MVYFFQKMFTVLCLRLLQLRVKVKNVKKIVYVIYINGVISLCFPLHWSAVQAHHLTKMHKMPHDPARRRFDPKLEDARAFRNVSKTSVIVVYKAGIKERIASKRRALVLVEANIASVKNIFLVAGISQERAVKRVK